MNRLLLHKPKMSLACLLLMLCLAPFAAFGDDTAAAEKVIVEEIALEETAPPASQPATRIRKSTTVKKTAFKMKKAGPNKAKLTEVIVSNEDAVKTGDMGLRAVGGSRSSFFGAGGGNAYNIVYIVDCSGLMANTFEPVRKELIRSIGKLSPKQTFHVIFTNRDEPHQLKTRRLIYATPANKLKAVEFIKEVSPTGVPEALWGLKEAFRVLDGARKKGQVIYLLTERLLTKDRRAVTDYLKTANTKKNVHINTFIYNTIEDEKTTAFLKQVAKDHGGKFKAVAYENPNPPVKRPLVSFMGIYVGKTQNVIFLIDRSGSMINSFDFVRNELNKSIHRLSEKQTFNVIFWGEKAPKTLSEKTLLPATYKNKEAATAFMKKIYASGLGDPLPALKAAMASLPEIGKGDSVIFLLTDGDLGKHYAAMLKHLVEQNTTRGAKVYTILYGSDKTIKNAAAIKNLKQIAKENNGEFKTVKYDN